MTLGGEFTGGESSWWRGDRTPLRLKRCMFRAQNVTQEKTKFGHVVCVLPARYASEVRDMILRPPEQRYKVLKAELTKRVCP